MYRKEKASEHQFSKRSSTSIRKVFCFQVVKKGWIGNEWVMFKLYSQKLFNKMTLINDLSTNGLSFLSADKQTDL